MTVLYNAKVPVSGAETFRIFRYLGAQPVNEWQVVVGVQAGADAVAAVRWTGTALEFGQIVTVPTIGRDMALADTRHVLVPPALSGDTEFRLFTAQPDGTLTTTVVDPAVPAGYTRAFTEAWATYHGDVFVIWDVLGFSYIGHRYRANPDGTVTFLGSAEMTGQTGIPVYNGVTDGGCANVAGNVLVWPCTLWSGAYRTIAFDLDVSAVTPTICTNVFTGSPATFNGAWASNGDQISIRAMPNAPSGREYVTGGAGFRRPTSTSDIDGWRWTGTDVVHDGIDTTTPGPQLGEKGLADTRPVASSHTWVGRASNDAGNTDELWWPIEGVAEWSALWRTADGGQGLTGGPFIIGEVEPGLLILADFLNETATELRYYVLGVATRRPVLYGQIHPRRDGLGAGPHGVVRMAGSRQSPGVTKGIY